MPPILIFIIALSVLVLVHELGHFLLAKKFGVHVFEFGLGFPPKILSKKIGKTIYSLNLFPIGGFVRMLESFEDGNIIDKIKYRGKDLESKPVWQKFLVVFGGVFMNMVLAVVIFSVVYSIVGVPQKTDKVQIVAISETSAIRESGINAGDYLLVLVEDGVQITSTDQFSSLARQYAEKEAEMKLIIGRESSVPEEFLSASCPERVQGLNCFEANVYPRKAPPEGEGALGVAITDMTMERGLGTRDPFWA